MTEIVVFPLRTTPALIFPPATGRWSLLAPMEERSERGLLQGVNIPALTMKLAVANPFVLGVLRFLIPKNVAFGEDGKVVVGGSDNGNVYVFALNTGAPIEILRHGGRTVQAVQASLSISEGIVVAYRTADLQ